MLILCMMCLMSVSCRSVESVERLKSNVESQEVHDSQLSTFDIQHSARRDSIVYREKVVHDTVYITKEVYRDQRLSTFDIHHSTKADTIHIVEYRDRVIEHPPKRYIPPFYKRCTLFFWLILVTSALYMMGKIYLKRRL